MKRIVVLTVMFVVFAVSLYASAWKSYSDYQAYLGAKKEAQAGEEEGNTLNAVAAFKKAGELAKKSATSEIYAWQLNNAAYALITHFQKLTDYRAKIDKLAGMQASPEKMAFQREIAEFFNLQMALLAEAKTILESLEGTENAEAPMEKVKSNLEFVTWVKEFVADNTGEGTETKKPADKE
ncbi:MAG TPA: hypothetical protein ENN43_08745 [bacterium]|nr:hypothetical protein [bacterium]